MKRGVDGAWAVVVLLAATISSGLTLGLANSAGVYTIEFLEHFSASTGAVGAITSVNVACALGGGPLANLLLVKLSYRQVVMLGGVMVTTGLAASVFATEVFHLCLSYGIVSGLGIAFIHVPGVILVSKYFVKFRNLASGLVFFGVTAAGVIYPFCLRVFIDEYGWRGSMLVTAGICLNSCACGALLLPPEVMRNNDPMFCIALQDHRKKEIHCSLLFKSIHFLLMAAHNLLFNVPFAGVLAFVPVYFYTSGFSKDTATLFLTVFAMGQLVGIVISSLLSNHRKVNAVYLLIGCHCASAVASCIIPLLSDFSTSMAAIFIYGCTLGLIIGLIVTVPLQLLGVEFFAHAYGFLKVAGGAGAFAGPPLIGIIYDATGTYDTPFYLMGAILLLAGMVVLLVFCRKPRDEQMTLMQSTENDHLTSGLAAIPEENVVILNSE